jgi:hypothetical protein
MPAVGDQVLVEGLRDFQKELQKAGKDWGKELRKANDEAAEPVALEARRRARRLGGVAAKTAAAIETKSEQRRVKVRIKGLGPRGKFPFGFGAEFGAIQYAQFPAWTGSGDSAGRFLFPASRDKPTLEKVEDVYFDALDRLARKAFPDRF